MISSDFLIDFCGFLLKFPKQDDNIQNFFIADPPPLPAFWSILLSTPDSRFVVGMPREILNSAVYFAHGQ